ncbi:OmpA family protein [Seongchinamella unica]|uniref:OmpA family protein n=1 Tax=Seongchinamella unica TaxID=2547392 RepID=A0A4R5LTD0_9GAMM|nr:OmpA family protein [Seongchinamella unica]TDG14199.1 OmpA family protein [Seongchinamella unica]
MNTSIFRHARVVGILAFTVATSFLVASCATAPQSPSGYAEVRSKLSALQSNADLANKVPAEIREAEGAVLAAEAPVGKDVALGEHRVYMADYLVEIARAKAETRYAEDQRVELSQARDDARLDARTREADKAHRETATAERAVDAARASATSDAAEAAMAAEAARASAASNAAESARNADEAARNAKELQRQIDVLQAEATDRGLVLTLGDVLFATGRSDLSSGGNKSLDKLIVFLNEYPDRNVDIEGHTDDVGSLDMNQTLSQHRADSVKSYLTQNGIRSTRLAATGLGETQPIAENSSNTGRQKNRRVEIIIKNPPSVIPVASTN